MSVARTPPKSNLVRLDHQLRDCKFQFIGQQRHFLDLACQPELQQFLSWFRLSFDHNHQTWIVEAWSVVLESTEPSRLHHLMALSISTSLARASKSRCSTLAPSLNPYLSVKSSQVPVAIECSLHDSVNLHVEAKCSACWNCREPRMCGNWPPQNTQASHPMEHAGRRSQTTPLHKPIRRCPLIWQSAWPVLQSAAKWMSQSRTEPSRYRTSASGG